jgi:hypothetical protein
MTTTRKKLAEVGSPTAATVTDLYTVPASTDTVVSVLMATNTSATATTISVSHALAGAADAAAQYLVKLMTIGGNETIPLLQGVVLAATDKLRVLNTLATVNFNLYGQENT